MKVKDSPSEDLLISWLANYQEDLLRIVQSCLFSGHSLSAQEVVSEINNYLIKRTYILTSKEIYNEIDFRKFVYGLAKNFTRWSANGYSKSEQNYLYRRVDKIISLNEENKTLFEHACESCGEEDGYFASLNNSHKYNNIIKWIFDYSNFLSDQQKYILKSSMDGHTVEKIGKQLGISHQAISSSLQAICEKIQSNIKIPKKSDKNIIFEGVESVNYLFKKKRR